MIVQIMAALNGKQLRSVNFHLTSLPDILNKKKTLGKPSNKAGKD